MPSHPDRVRKNYDPTKDPIYLRTLGPYEPEWRDANCEVCGKKFCAELWNAKQRPPYYCQKHAHYRVIEVVK